MSTKTRIVVVSILILLGGVLFGYCAAFYPTENAAQLEPGSTMACDAQMAAVQGEATGDSETVASDPPSRTAPSKKPRPRVGAT